MKKTLLVGLLVFTLVGTLIAGGTLAWFTDTKEIANTFTAGTVKIEVNEHGFEDIKNWNPGDTVDKDVSVISRGTKKVYVRVALTPVWGSYDGDSFCPEDSLSVDNVVLETNSDNWVYSEGWYYYKEILEEDEETELLLNSVTLKGKETGNKYQGKTLRINVKAEAVQASNEAFKDVWNLNELPEGMEEWEADEF